MFKEVGAIEWRDRQEVENYKYAIYYNNYVQKIFGAFVEREEGGHQGEEQSGGKSYQQIGKGTRNGNE